MSRPRTPAPCVLLAEEVWGSTLQAIRELGRAGVPVYVATAGEGSNIYRRSRYCTAAADFDPTDPAQMCTDLIDWLSQQGVADAIAGSGDERSSFVPIIPLSDHLVDVLHQSRSTFPTTYRLSIPEPAVVSALLDKSASLRVAERAGLHVPKWVEVETLEHIDRASALELPVAIRPTQWSTAGDEYFKIAVGRTPAELTNLLDAAVRRGATLIAQEFVEANEDDVELAITWNSRDGSQVAVCTGRKRRQSSPDGGVMVWGEARDIPELRDLAASFLEAAGFAGLGGLEFIRADGTPWFIEFNPRLEAIHFLAGRAGLHTVLMEYQELSTGKRQSAIPAQLPATAWIGSAWLARLIAQPTAWKTAIADRIAFARSPRRIRAVWTWSDPAPGIAVAARLVSRAARSATKKTGFRH